MELSRIAQDLGIEYTGPQAEITAVDYDSRKVGRGSLFCCLVGEKTDGHNFASMAVEKGASALICQRPLPLNVPQLIVPDGREAMARAAACFYGHPERELTMLAVTGTNGKTSVTYMVKSVAETAGKKVGLIGTIQNLIGEEKVYTERTTPESVDLFALLRRMADKGVELVVMEVSSHALAQQRVAGIPFKAGLFTNLTQDHLDYHKTFENYLKAKKAFFDNLPKQAFALTNLDDKNGTVMTQNTKAKVAAYSLHSLCDFKGKVLEDSFDGMLLDINNREVNVQFIGRFNASNLLAVYGAACLLGKRPEDILVKLSMLRPVSGRFDAKRSPKGYTAIVDYAHTPDALVNVLEAIHEVLRGRGQVITVVGAGGNRDKGKRPLMAKESAQRSDKVIITSDNPRFEEPQDIINDMLAGLSKDDMKKVISIVDRKEAIRTACMLAQPQDVILIAGKGHETYQDIKGVKSHFDDKEVLDEIFKGEL